VFRVTVRVRYGGQKPVSVICGGKQVSAGGGGKCPTFEKFLVDILHSTDPSASRGSSCSLACGFKLPPSLTPYIIAHTGLRPPRSSGTC